MQGFLKPEGRRLHLLLRVPLVALRDVDYPTRGPGYLDLTRAEPVLADAARRWIGDPIELFEGESSASHPADRGPPGVAARPTGASEPSKTRRPISGARPWPPTRRSPGRRGCSTCGSSTRSSRPRPGSRSTPRSTGWGCGWSPSFASSPRGRRARVRARGRSGPRPPRSALAPGRAAFRRLGLLPHPGGDRPSALPALPGDPVPALAAARPHRHLVHGRALGHSHRRRPRLRSGRAVVPSPRSRP